MRFELNAISMKDAEEQIKIILDKNAELFENRIGCVCDRTGLTRAQGFLLIRFSYLMIYGRQPIFPFHRQGVDRTSGGYPHSSSLFVSDDQQRDGRRTRTDLSDDVTYCVVTFPTYIPLSFFF